MARRFIVNRHDSISFTVKAVYVALNPGCIFDVIKAKNISGILNSQKWLKEKARLAKEVVTVSPETSTLPEYCMA